MDATTIMNAGPRLMASESRGINGLNKVLAQLCSHLSHEVIIDDVSVIREREICDGTSLPTEVTVFKVCASGGANGY
jgi:hypothetical protein